MDKTLTFLEKIIGGQRALIITCMECCLDIEQRITGQVFRYTSLGNMVNPGDEYQKQSITNFVEFKGCTRIIVVGHDNCKALEFLLSRDSERASSNYFKHKLSQMLFANHEQLLSKSLKDRVLVEQNVITQCRELLEHKSIGKKFSDKAITVTGIVLHASGLCSEVFSNGISYNNMLSMN